jgi:hypothetical protein
MDNKFPYKHTLRVSLTTQFPKDKEYLEALIKIMLGPWCDKVQAEKLNEIEN